ncbi:MAG: dihydroorotate dehydrogenase [Oscillospiraceae bacterium]|nr:dihydroorotate dehydrogenase [Oscillospiraceae bacterium]
MNITTTLSGITLKSPIIPASGTFGFGYEFPVYNPIYDIGILGGISIKGTTKEARFGNPTPRAAECYAGMLNSVGLQNPGIDAVLATEIPKLRSVYSGAIIANICGFSLEEYVHCVTLADGCADIDIIELNISCPNVKDGGHAFGTDPKTAAEITAAVRAVTTKPLYIKLTPNVTDIVSVAKACESAGADGLSLINTLLGMRIDPRTRRPVLANKMGGFSGPAIFPVALRIVYQVYSAVSIPIIGMGGVSSARDVVEMMLAGATAVQVGTANLVNPYACRDIVEELPKVMEKYGIASLTEIIGGAH